MKIDYTSIGIRVRNARKKIGITQQTLAEISEQTPTNISHIETGRTKVSLPTLIKIANALNVSADELLCDSIQKTKYVFQDEISQAAQDCSDKEIRVIAETVKFLKTAIRKNYGG